MSFPEPPAAPAPAYTVGPPKVGPGQPAKLRGHLSRRLGWTFLGASVALLIAGLVVLGMNRLDEINGFHRLPYPAGGALTLDGTGKWVIYLEAVDAGPFTRAPFNVEVTAPTGRPVPTEYYGHPGAGQRPSTFTYSYKDNQGVAVYQFVAQSAGSYDIEPQHLDFLSSDTAYLAIGRDIRTSTTVGNALTASGLLALLAATVLLIVGFAKKTRHKKEILGPPDNFGGAARSHAPPPPYGGALPPPGYNAPPGSPPYPGAPPPGPPPVIR